LEDSNNPNSPRQPLTNASPFWRRWFIEKPKARLEKRRARKQQENAEERYARKTAAATVWMAIFTIVIAAVGFLQWRVLSGQLQVMRDSNSDTTKLIQANQDLATAAKTQAENSGKLVDAANRSAGYAQTASVATQGQLLEMRDEQRPIVDVATIENATPLQTDPVVGAFIKFNLVNSGKSAAILAYPHAKLILNSRDSVVLKRTKEACSAPVRGANGSTKVGFNIRAGVTMPIGAAYVLTPEETKTWKAKPQLRMLIVGCIDYMFDSRHHHTPFIQEVDRRDAAAPEGWLPINPNTDKVDAGGLVFLIPPWFTAEPD
jgi:hypothetical protein